MSDDLLALSPLDGRYRPETESLREYFSEFAYLRGRVQVELGYLTALSQEAGLIRALTDGELDLLHRRAADFSLEEARQIKDLERSMRHDVKAVETFLRARLAPTSLSDLLEYLHFGLTSEDVNNIAQALALRDSRDAIILPALRGILERLARLAETHASTPMLARTHGRPAVATTFGKELAVFYARLEKGYTRLAAHRFEAKLNGAVGDFNALLSAAPQVNWIAFSDKFIQRLSPPRQALH